VSLWIYAPNVDAAFERATKAGAKPGMPPQDVFWGDRMGTVVDKWGITWTLATHTKDLTPEQLKKGQDAFVAEMAKQKKQAYGRAAAPPQRTGAPRPPSRYRPLVKSLSVAVLGGGTAGLSTALALARAGHRVQLVERDPVEVTSGEDAFHWPRKGVAHFLLP